MKFGKLAIVALVLGASFTACKTQMSEEEISKKVAEKIATEKTAVEAEADKECEANFNASVEAAAQKIVEEKKAAMATPAAPAN